MNKKELELATHFLGANILDQVQKVVPYIAADIMAKFDRGPKPNIQEKVQISLNIEITARAIYEIENRVRIAKGNNHRQRG